MKMLPDPQTFLKLAGFDLFNTLSHMQASKGGVNPKTVKNWFTGKSEPTLSAVRRYIGGLVEYAKSSWDSKADATLFMAQFNDAVEHEGDPFFLAWENCIQGYERGAQKEPWLPVEEIKQFVELTRTLKQHVKDQNPQELARTLNESFIPKTEITLAAIRQLQESNQFTENLVRKSLAPIIITNILYLIACLDTKHELLARLYPLYEAGRISLPIERWMDGVRRRKSLSSDTKLGKLFYPKWDDDSAKREMAYWRAGNVPSWKNIQKLQRDHDNEDVEVEFFSIRILHKLYDELSSPNGAEFDVDCQALFETAPQLQKLANEREKLLADNH